MTQKQIKKLLTELSVDLQSEIKAAKNNLKNARTATTRLSTLLDSAQGLFDEAKESQDGVASLLGEATTSVAGITSNVVSARAELEKIKLEAAEITSKSESVTLSYQEFTDLKEKIDDEDDGLQAILDVADELRTKIESNSTSSSALLVEIKAALGLVGTEIEELKVAYDDFIEIKEKIDDEDDGLQALLADSTDLKDKIAAVAKGSQTLYAEISRYKEEAARDIAGIQTIREDSQEALDAIKKDESTSKEIKDRISKIFSLVSQSGHANYFDKRKKTLIRASAVWIVLAISSIIAAIVLVNVYLLPLFEPVTAVVEGNEVIGEPKDVELGALLLRSSLVTPVLALAIFSLKQYGQDRRLAEQYAFKAVSASTVEGSITLIKRSLEGVPGDHLNDLLADFAVLTARNLHAEPQELQKASKFKFSAGNKLVNIGAELNDSIEDLSKEVKDAARLAKGDN